MFIQVPHVLLVVTTTSATDFLKRLDSKMMLGFCVVVKFLC